MWDFLWLGVDIATMQPGAGPWGAIRDGALGLRDGRIAWAGRRADLPGRAAALAKEVRSGEGQWITPGLIDCHTHIVYGGNRAREFEMRLQGASYEEIARAGGGIISTVAATRAASEEELLDSAARRLVPLIAEGVMTVEIKSGYGLDLETELKQLRVARRLGSRMGVTVRTSFLGGHALPPEFDGRPDEYVRFVCEESLPAAAAEGLVDAVDAFCESIGFSAAQTERIFRRATELGLPVKLHADQLSDSGGGALAARFGALSADHLEFTGEAGVKAMAGAGTVAVLLPGAFYTLGETKLPPVAELRENGVAMAIATDSNPGSSPVTSILTTMNMACIFFRLTPEEGLAGVTRNAAAALGLGESHGTLEPGKVADFCVWDIDDPAELAYRVGFSPLSVRVRAGRELA